MINKVICIKDYDDNRLSNHPIIFSLFKKGEIYDATNNPKIGRNQTTGGSEYHVFGKDRILVFSDEYFQMYDEYINNKIKSIL